MQLMAQWRHTSFAPCSSAQWTTLIGPCWSEPSFQQWDKELVESESWVHLHYQNSPDQDEWENFIFWRLHLFQPMKTRLYPDLMQKPKAALGYSENTAKCFKGLIIFISHNIVTFKFLLNTWLNTVCKENFSLVNWIHYKFIICHYKL
jgi:hypothetical protein